ncbi:MAG: TetR/AcrR family transcriptional regulator [Deltaproteobacteria bacterium]|nr:TetR/AcrR family transcriptional regulator [Deltaproteobacteria bacterium]
MSPKAPAKNTEHHSGRVYGGMSVDERVAKRRRQFLDAGLRVFGTEGYRSATVRKVCAEAGLTDRYFYESFANMEALLMAVYKTAMYDLRERIFAALADLPTPLDARQAVVAGLDAFYRWAEDPQVTRVCWLEVLGVGPDVDAMYMGNIRRFAATLIDIAHELHPNAKLDSAEEELIGIALIGSVTHTTMHWLLSGYAASREKMVNATARIFSAALDTMESGEK